MLTPYAVFGRFGLSQSIIVWLLSLAATAALADDLIVGQVAELSGQAVVADSVAGARLWFDYVGKLSPKSHRYVLKQYDDARDPVITIEMTKKLVYQDKAIALFGYRSTPSMNALSKELDAYEIALVAPFNGSATIRTSAKNVFFLRGSYLDEAHRLVDQLATMGIRRVSVVYQEDSFGQEGLQGFQAELKANRIELVSALSYDRNTLDVKAAIGDLVKKQPGATLMACTPKACANIINSVRRTDKSMIFGVMSNAVNTEFIKLISESGRNVLMSQVMPYPWSTSIPIARDFNRLNALSGNKVPVSYASMEGFAAARLLTEAVDRAGATPTRASVLAALRKMKDVDLGGLWFNPPGGRYFTEVTTLTSGGKIVR